MNKPMPGALAPFILSALMLNAPACSSGNDPSRYAAPVHAVFVNQSQFTLEALYLHDQPLNYNDQTNLLTQPLAAGETIEDDIPGRVWYVTVFRQPNKDSDVLAYTTATAWDALNFPKIIYFDEQFRVSRLE